MIRALILVICICALTNTVFAQQDVRKESGDVRLLQSDPHSVLYRYWQVTGDLPVASSFMLRPVPARLDARPPDKPEYGDRPPIWQLRSRWEWRENRLELDRRYAAQSREFEQLRRKHALVRPEPGLFAARGQAWVQAGPLRTTNVYNRTLPHGSNLEAIFASRGLTTLWSVQASAALGPLQLRLEPTFLYDQNRPFETLPIDYPDFIWRFHYEYLFNRIDRPFRYRNDAYLRVLPGNSELMLHFHGLAAGVSTSTMWWGPGYRNSLLLSNHAEGFPHLTLRSDRPLRSVLGRFEFQAFWGQLEESGVDHLPPRRFGNTLPMNYQSRPDDWRLFSGLMLTWQPRWTPGLTVGAGRTIMAYSDDVKRWDQALFSFLRSPFEDIPETREDQLKPDLRHRFDDKFALYIRYLAPGDRLEVYGEWGRNARPASWSDFMELPEHGMAWILGMNTFFPLGGPLRYIRLGAEFTQLEKTNTWRVRDYPTWYVHPVVRHGYTHRGQILGAAMGPGSNAQYIGVDYLHGRNRIGAYVERTIYNNDLYYIMFTTSRLRHWADVNFGLEGSFTHHRVTVSGRLSFIHTLNYQYVELTQVPGEYIGNDIWNTHGLLQVMYRF